MSHPESASRISYRALRTSLFVILMMTTLSQIQSEMPLAPDRSEQDPWIGSWICFGPVASNKLPGKWRPWFEPRCDPTALDGIAQIPSEVLIDGIIVRPRSFNYEGREIDLQQLWHTNVGQGVVYFLRKETSERTGLLPVSCLAEGWIKCWVNGELVYASGSDRDGMVSHQMTLPLEAGENVVNLRISAAMSGWRFGLFKGRLQPLNELQESEATIKWEAGPTDEKWQYEHFQETATDGSTLRIAATTYRPAQGFPDTHPESKDRLIRTKVRRLAVTGDPAECFIQIKDSIMVGFTSNRDLHTGERQVVWQIRQNGHSIWEVDHKPVNDWAGVSPLAGVQEIKTALEQSQMDLDGLAGRAKEMEEVELIAASRGDEITLRVSNMEGRVLRKRIPGTGSLGGRVGIQLQGMAVEVTSFKAEVLPEELSRRWSLADNPPIKWSIPPADPMKTGGGYPVFMDLKPITLFRASPSEWTFSHHPKIAYVNGRFYAAWSNSFMHEDSAGTRVRGATSRDGKTWSASFIMIPSLSEPADEFNEPHKAGIAVWPNGIETFVGVRDRVYIIGQAGYRKGYLGKSGDMGLIARAIDQNNEMGPIFWLTREIPLGGEAFPSYLSAGSEQLKKDGEDILKQLRLSDIDWLGKASSRDIYRGKMPEAADHSIISHDPVYKCPDGTEMRVFRNYNGTHRLYVSYRQSPDDPWSLGIPTDIPDSPSGVAVGELPDGQAFLIGNLIAGELDDPDARPYRDPRKAWPFQERDFQPEHFPRDPLVLALSNDGKTFDRAWAIRHDTPDARYSGLGWIPGFQYPDSIVANDALWTLYSVNKEDIEVLQIPLSRLTTSEKTTKADLSDMFRPEDEYTSATLLERLPGCELRSVIHQPSDEKDWAYSHTPCIQKLGSELICAWVNCWRDEIEARTRVVFKVSTDDGESWSPLKILVDDPDGEGPEMRANSGLWKRGDELYALVIHGRTGGPYGQPVDQSASTHLYRYLNENQQFVNVGKIKDNWWAHGNPTVLSDENYIFHWVRDDHVTKEMIIGGRESLFDWKPVLDSTPAHIKRFSESSGYQLDNGNVLIYYRDNDPADRYLYRSRCNPDGSEFETPIKTDCPDAPSKQHANRFPNGKIFIVGNLAQGSGREFLCYTESDDGYLFDKPRIIDSNKDPCRIRKSEDYGLQYPTTTVIDGKVYIPVSRAKEDIRLYVYNPSS